MTLHVMGEALIDLIISADGSIDAVPGGGPFNLARAAARLGTEVTFAGGISDDPFGRRIAELLLADGVSTSVPTRTGRPTTLALAQINDAGSATYTFYMDGTAGAMVHTDEIAPRGIAAAIALGTLSIVMEPIASAIEEACRRIPAETLVFFDPNCRPSTVRDRQAFVSRVQRLYSYAQVVKVSTEDIEFLHPGTDPREAALAILALGPQVVLLTDGGQAVTVFHTSGAFHVEVPTVTVVDSVGAGDAFGGAFLSFWLGIGHGVSELADTEALRATVERAVTVAAYTCTRQGANPPWIDEIPTL